MEAIELLLQEFETLGHSGVLAKSALIQTEINAVKKIVQKEEQVAAPVYRSTFPDVSFPVSFQESFQLGLFFQFQFNYSKAAFHFQKALEEHPTHLDSLLLIGQNYYFQFQSKRAFKYLEKAYSIASKNKDLLKSQKAAFYLNLAKTEDITP